MLGLEIANPVSYNRYSGRQEGVCLRRTNVPLGVKERPLRRRDTPSAVSIF